MRGTPCSRYWTGQLKSKKWCRMSARKAQSIRRCSALLMSSSRLGLPVSHSTTPRNRISGRQIYQMRAYTPSSPSTRFLCCEFPRLGSDGDVASTMERVCHRCLCSGIRDCASNEAQSVTMPVPTLELTWDRRSHFS